MARGQPLPPARDKSRVPLLLKRPASPDAPGASLRHLLLNRWPGRLLIGTLVLKVVLWIVEATVGTNAVVDWLNTLVRVGLLVSLAYFLSRLVKFTRQPLPVARPAAPRRLLHLHRRRPGAAAGGVLPVRRGADVPQRQRLPVQERRRSRGGRRARSSRRRRRTRFREGRGTRARGGRRTAEARAVREALERRYENHLERYPGLSIAYVPRVAPQARAGQHPSRAGRRSRRHADRRR